jgi:hypothetical protein
MLGTLADNAQCQAAFPLAHSDALVVSSLQ